MAIPKGPTEGGSGGKRGHSGMKHWGYTEEVKKAAKLRRRIEDKEIIREECNVHDFEYLAVQWLHQNRDYPIELYSELDSARFEARKVEVFADGRTQFADASQQKGDSALSIEPIPPLEEIAADPEFSPRVISAEVFESIWRKARTNDP